MAILDPTRSTPMGFWRFSANCLVAARAVRAKLDTTGALLFPTLHLYGLSIELALKAFLLQRGQSLRQVKGLSHNLTNALSTARRRKLGRVVKLSRYDVGAILALDVTYASKELRYIITGSTKVPAVSQLAGAAERLVAGIEVFCTGRRGQLARYPA